MHAASLLHWCWVVLICHHLFNNSTLEKIIYFFVNASTSVFTFVSKNTMRESFIKKNTILVN